MESSIAYKPKFARVLIRREVETKSKGGIIILDDSARKWAKCEGTIVALGETAGWTEGFDHEGNPINIQTMKIGDTVIFGRHAGAWLDSTFTAGKENDDGTLFICQDQDILAVKEAA